MGKPNVNLIINGSSNNQSYIYRTIVLKNNLGFEEQVTEENCKYIVKWDFNLNNKNIIIPKDCIIYFDGGSLSEGTIVCNNTIIEGNKRGDVSLTGVYSDITFNYIKDKLISIDEKIQFIQEKIEELFRKLQSGFTMEVSPKVWKNSEEVFTAEISTIDENDTFEEAKLYINDVLIEEVENVQTFIFNFTLNTPSTIKCIGKIKGSIFTEEKIVEERISITSFTVSPNTVEKNISTLSSFSVNVSANVSRIEVKQGETVIGSGSGSTLTFTYNVTATSNESIPFTAYAYQEGLLVDQMSISVDVTETRYGYVGGGITYEDAMNDSNKVTNFGSGTRTYNAHADQGDYYWFIFPEGITVTSITAYGFTVPISDRGIVTVGGKNYKVYQNNDQQYSADNSTFNVTF